MTRCRICRAGTEVDENGRCSSCKAVYEATSRGLTYGQLMQTGYSSGLHAVKEIAPDGWAFCTECGKMFKKFRINQATCSGSCQKRRNHRLSAEYNADLKGVLR